MILVDSCIWMDHIQHKDVRLTFLLEAERVAIHPFIIGEIALGNLKHKKSLNDLCNLQHVIHASEDEVMFAIKKHSLSGTGIGYIDAHLLVSAQLSSVRLWTRDKRLHAAAVRMGVAYAPIMH